MYIYTHTDTYICMYIHKLLIYRLFSHPGVNAVCYGSKHATKLPPRISQKTKEHCSYLRNVGTLLSPCKLSGLVYKIIVNFAPHFHLNIRISTRAET